MVSHVITNVPLPVECNENQSPSFFLTENIEFSILCGDLAIKAIEEPFISDADDGEEWAI